MQIELDDALVKDFISWITDRKIQNGVPAQLANKLIQALSTQKSLQSNCPPRTECPRCFSSIHDKAAEERIKFTDTTFLRIKFTDTTCLTCGHSWRTAANIHGIPLWCPECGGDELEHQEASK